MQDDGVDPTIKLHVVHTTVRELSSMAVTISLCAYRNNQVVGVEEMAREMVHNVATEPSQLNISPNVRPLNA